MATYREEKIKKLLAEHKPGTVCLASWLDGLGISHDLQKHYRRSGWLESVGTGALKRPGDNVGWQGALYALQAQARLPVHVGAFTALSLQGTAHYLRLGAEPVYLFSPPKVALAAWFRKYSWGNPIRHVSTSILPSGLGLNSHEDKNIPLTIASRERAILECLHLAPDVVGLVECYQVIEMLNNLRPKLVQQLLEACNSVKVKRLFLYMADKAGHQWLSYVDQDKLDLGKGDRMIVSGGTYVSRFHISVPKELTAL